MIQNEKFEEMNNEDCLRHLIDIRNSVVNDDLSLKKQFVISNNWVAVPVESSTHFLDEVHQISNAIFSMKEKDCLAINLETLEDSELICYKFKNSKANLISFCMKCGLENYLITTEKFEYAILCTSEDHYVLAGPLKFVNLATGKPIMEMRKNFICYAESFINKKTKEFFLKISKNYSELNGDY